VGKLEQWLVGHACELGQAGIDPRKLRANVVALGNRLSKAARAVAGQWLADLVAETSA
jgi:GMP synthase (glutamine-hydrolysing)